MKTAELLILIVLLVEIQFSSQFFMRRHKKNSTHVEKPPCQKSKKSASRSENEYEYYENIDRSLRNPENSKDVEDLTYDDYKDQEYQYEAEIRRNTTEIDKIKGDKKNTTSSDHCKNCCNEQQNKGNWEICYVDKNGARNCTPTVHIEWLKKQKIHKINLKNHPAHNATAVQFLKKQFNYQIASKIIEKCYKSETGIMRRIMECIAEILEEICKGWYTIKIENLVIEH